MALSAVYNNNIMAIKLTQVNYPEAIKNSHLRFSRRWENA